MLRVVWLAVILALGFLCFFILYLSFIVCTIYLNMCLEQVDFDGPWQQLREHIQKRRRVHCVLVHPVPNAVSVERREQVPYAIDPINVTDAIIV